MSVPVAASVSVPAKPVVTSSGDSTVGKGNPSVIVFSSVSRPRPTASSLGSSVAW